MVKGPNKEFVDLWGGGEVLNTKQVLYFYPHFFFSRNLRVIGGKCLSFVNR